MTLGEVPDKGRARSRIGATFARRPSSASEIFTGQRSISHHGRAQDKCTEGYMLSALYIGFP